MTLGTNKLLIVLVFFLFSCKSQSDYSFKLLSKSFLTWYDKNHPVESTIKNIQKYDNIYRKNDYKSKEQYVLDLNRFYFELSQINSKKLNKIHQFEYSRLEKNMLQLLYVEESIKPSEWMPSIELLEIYSGLKSLTEYDYIPMNNKMISLNERLNDIEKILNNTLINLVFLSKDEFDKCILIIESINKYLDTIEMSIDYTHSSFEEILLNKKQIKKIFKDYKNKLKSAKNQFLDINYSNSFIMGNKCFSIMSESKEQVSDIFKVVSKDLKSEQIKLFNNSLPIYLMNNDEPIWVDYQDTINIINYVIKDIDYNYRINNFNYIKKHSINNTLKNIEIDYSFYNNIKDLFFLDEDYAITFPLNTERIQINLPKLNINFLSDKDIFFNSIQFDLLNANYIFPGAIYAFYSSLYQSDIIHNFPSQTSLKGLRRYAERIFIKTSEKSTIHHQIIHQKNIIKDICKCYIDIEYNSNNVEIDDLKLFLKNNCFLDYLEINIEIQNLKNQYFGYLSKNYIGFKEIIRLEKKYFNNYGNYFDFYNQLLKYGIIDIENLYLLVENK